MIIYPNHRENGGLEMAMDTKKIVSWLAAIGVPLCILLLPTSEMFTAEIRLFLAVTICAILLWATEPVHLIVPSLILPPAYILLGLAKPAEVYSPWSQAIPWLLIGGYIISAVFEKTGLMKRVAYWCIIKAGGSYKGILFGILFSGMLIALLVPSNSGRVALYCALTYGICKALDLKPHSNAASAIMMCGFFAAIAVAFMYMTGSDTIIMTQEMLKEYGYGFTWLEYAKLNVPIFIIWGVIQVFILLVMLKPDSEIQAKTYFVDAYNALGKWSRDEKKMAVIFLLIFGLLIQGSLAPQWIFLFAACICFLPGIELADESTLKQVNYSMLIFVTSTMAIGTVATKVGAGQWVADAVFPIMSAGGTVFTYFSVWLIAVVINFLLTPLAAVASLSVPMIELSLKLGVNPITVIFTFLQGLNQVIFPYEYALVLLMFSYCMISMKNLMKVFGVRMAVNLLFILLIAMPYWGLLGYIRL